MDLHTWWNDFLTMKEKKRIPHALLLLNDTTDTIIDIAWQMAAAILCGQPKEPCLVCKACQFTQRKEHPDMHWIEPENEGGAIKIEQIRALYPLAFTSPQLAHNRVIILCPSDRLNLAAANALLKLLEEPPEGVFFLLIAQQIKHIPATIVSRCQQWWLPSLPIENYLQLGERYSIQTAKGRLFSKQSEMLDELVSMLQGDVSSSTLANKWTNAFELRELLWWLYLLNAQLLQEVLQGANSSCSLLAEKGVAIFLLQLNTINKLTRKLQDGITLNASLAIETLLLEYDMPGNIG